MECTPKLCSEEYVLSLHNTICNLASNSLSCLLFILVHISRINMAEPSIYCYFSRFKSLTLWNLEEETRVWFEHRCPKRCNFEHHLQVFYLNDKGLVSRTGFHTFLFHKALRNFQWETLKYIGRSNHFLSTCIYQRTLLGHKFKPTEVLASQWLHRMVRNPL